MSDRPPQSLEAFRQESLLKRNWILFWSYIKITSMPMNWHTSCVIWCCTMRSGCWVRTAARCLLPSPRRLTVLPWAVMLRSHNALLLLPLWCVRHLSVRRLLLVRAKSSCSITTS